MFPVWRGTRGDDWIVTERVAHALRSSMCKSGSPTSTWNGMGKCATDLHPIRFEVWENEEFLTQTK